MTGPASPPAPTKDARPGRNRVWFRAACAVVPFVAIFLVFVAVNHTTSGPPASSTIVTTHPVPVRPTGSGGAHGTPSSTGGTAHEPPVSTTASDAPGGSTDGAPSGDQGASADAAAWVAAHSELFGELRADATNMDADAANQDFPSLPGDCVHLQQDLQIAQGTPPVPNAFDEALWGQALGDFAQAISECPNGSALHNDVSTTSESSQNTSSGESALMTMLGDIEEKGSS